MGFDGFDSVELVMDVEDLFALRVPDRDAEQLHTAGDLRSYLVGRLGAEPNGNDDRCQSAAAFRRTRRTLADVLGIDAAALRSRTRLWPLLPVRADARRAVWRGFARRLGLPYFDPTVTGRKAMAIAILLVGSGAGLAVLAYLLVAHVPLGGASAGAALVAVTASLTAQTIAFATGGDRLGPLKVSAFATVGDLSGALHAQQTLDRMSGMTGGWTDRDVWAAVQCLTAKAADMAPCRIRPDTRFDRLP